MITNADLVAYCKKALSEKWGYVWGTFGQVLSEAFLQQKIKQYPKEVGGYSTFIRSNWLNRRVADCVGLIKGCYWNGGYDPKTDHSADGMYNIAKEKGPLTTMPDIPGTCVWKTGHIGVYIGNGLVIEAHGTTSGVIQTPLKGSGSTTWTHWLKCPYVTYVESVLKSTDDIKSLQTKLKKIGYTIDLNGLMDYKTQQAVRNFQTNNNLPVSGVVDKLTMKGIDDMCTKLDKTTKTFEDIIREVSDGSAEEWIEKVNIMQKAAEAEGDLGAFEFCKYFKTLIVKVYYHK